MMLGMNQSSGSSFHKRIKIFFKTIYLPDAQPSKFPETEKESLESRWTEKNLLWGTTYIYKAQNKPLPHYSCL